MSDDGDELRALVREVIRDVLPQGLPVTETVNLSTDEDLAAFVSRLLDLDPEPARGDAVRPETVQAGRPATRAGHRHRPGPPARPGWPRPRQGRRCAGSSAARSPRR